MGDTSAIGLGSECTEAVLCEEMSVMTQLDTVTGVSVALGTIRGAAVEVAGLDCEKEKLFLIKYQLMLAMMHGLWLFATVGA